MASSPLEIYEKAYRLHYDENDIGQACEIYKQIITEFPDSTESGYAAIQLQKIQSEDLIRKLDRRRKPAVILTIVAAVVIVVLVAAYGVLGYFFFQRMEIESRKSSLLTQALGLMYLNRDADALRVLQEAKDLQTADLSPYALSADIYLRRGDIANARAEYDAYNRKHATMPGAMMIDTKPAPAAKAPTPQTSADSPANDAPGDGKQPVGARLSDKNSVIKFLDSLSSAP